MNFLHFQSARVSNPHHNTVTPGMTTNVYIDVKSIESIYRQGDETIIVSNGSTYWVKTDPSLITERMNVTVWDLYDSPK